VERKGGFSRSDFFAGVDKPPGEYYALYYIDHLNMKGRKSGGYSQAKGRNNYGRNIGTIPVLYWRGRKAEIS
jgi:hypothetical protein